MLRLDQLLDAALEAVEEREGQEASAMEEVLQTLQEARDAADSAIDLLQVELSGCMENGLMRRARFV